MNPDINTTAEAVAPVHSVSLRALLPSASFVGCGDWSVRRACHDSRRVQVGDTFFNCVDTNNAGPEGARNRSASHRHAGEAIARGAAAIVTPRPLTGCPIPQCLFPDPAVAFGRMCHALAGDPGRQVQVVGITGTNGKSTVAWLIRAAISRLAGRCGLMGTIEYDDGCHIVPAPLTTPPAPVVARWLHTLASHGTRFAAIELSSHGLAQGRTAGLPLQVALVTHLSHDHLDYHHTAAAYRAAKERIIEGIVPGGVLVLNRDDERLAGFAATANVPRMGFGTQPQDSSADVCAVSETAGLWGQTLRLTAADQQVTTLTRLVGAHNLSNIAAAVTALLRLGFSLSDIAGVLPELSAPPGRLEEVTGPPGTRIFVDYAHTPDAIERVTTALQQWTRGRLIVVMGAGGDRDRSKRAAMGRAASQADLLVLTSDNPRSEDPAAILRDLAAGVALPREFVLQDPCRRSAIRRAVTSLREGDTLLVAGKGHERVQIHATGTVPFCDAEEITAAVQQLQLWRPSSPARRAA